MDPDVEIMFIPASAKPVPRTSLRVNLSQSFNRKTLPPLEESNIDEIWEKRTERNSKLWNGTKFRIESTEEISGVVIFNLGVTCYKDFIGTNWAPNAKELHKLGLKNHQNAQAFMSDALGVGALLCTNDNHIVLLKRSAHCGEAVGLWDIPGGHPEPQEIVGKIPMSQISMESIAAESVVKEIFDSVLKEIVDEVNIPLNCLSDPLLIGIARNTTSAGRPSSEYIVRCSLSSQEVEALYKKGDHAEKEESTSILFVHLSEVLTLKDKGNLWKEMAPSAKGCVTLYTTLLAANRQLGE